ncbi:uncharacterized protein [Drosophila pseudoobscura]|uniref:Transmembrane protein 135 N-terminal domain-containing protein n=1 Tax=Drosophila pseudoobscura pseudoobscura TaxID=46245 RepID=A0A6I8VBH8_DROPS|nr:uncharacterized protein LOC4801397 [Drosophila pseudoobscura]
MAVAPSKLLERPLNRLHCCVLHSRPGQSCTHALLWNIYRNHVSSAKYYSPLLLLPLVLKWRKVSKGTILAIVKNYLQSVSFASCINAFTFYFMCVARRLKGRFVFIYTPYLSCWLASQLSWWMPPQVLLYFSTGITHAALESLLRQWDLGLVHSRWGQTMVFMLSSLVVLHYQQAQKYSGFWFIKPTPLPVDYPKWSAGKRLRQSLTQFGTYLGIGLALDLGHAIMRRNLMRLRLDTTRFLVGYMGLFQLMQWLLLRMRLKRRQANAVAAFVSGVSFALLNRTTLMTFAMVTASQVIWQQVCTRDPGKEKLLAFLQKIPWAKLLIPCSLAYLVHTFFFHEDILNGLARDFIDCTCDHNGQRLLNLMKLPNENVILTAVNRSPRTSFWF